MTTQMEKPSRSVPLDDSGDAPIRTRPRPRGGALLSHVLLGRHAKQIEFTDNAIM